jgi:acetyl esterase/lipase
MTAPRRLRLVVVSLCLLGAAVAATTVLSRPSADRALATGIRERVVTAAATTATPTGVTRRTYTTAAGGSVIGFWNTKEVAAAPSRSLPWIVFVHGGGWVAGSPDIAPAVSFCTREASLGVDCFSVGYSLAPKKIWPAQQDEVESELAWVRNHAATFHLDPDLGFVAGHSAGGLMAGVAGLEDNHLAGVITLDGATDVPYTIQHRLDPGVSHDASLLVGGASAISTLAESARVIAHVTDATTRVPFLIVHDDDDVIVSPVQSTDLAAALSKDGFPVSFDLFPGKTHSTDVDPAAMSAVDSWLQGRLSILRAQLKPPALVWHRPSVTTLALSTTSTVVGQRITAAVGITGYGGAAAGTVRILSAGKTVATGRAAAGNATLAFTPTRTGTRTYTAVYAGSSTFASSTSAARAVIVRARTTPVVRLRTNPSRAKAGKSVIATVTVTGPSGSATGTVAVQLRSGKTWTTSGTATLVNGKGTVRLHPARVADYVLRATYGGSAAYAKAASSTFTLTTVA